jgi:hypothetical protein
LKAGADPDARDDAGKSPRELAAAMATLRTMEGSEGGGGGSLVFSHFFSRVREGRTLLEAATAAAAINATSAAPSTPDAMLERNPYAKTLLGRPLQPPAAAMREEAPPTERERRELAAASSSMSSSAAVSSEKRRGGEEEVKGSSELETEEDRELQAEAEKVAEQLKSKVQQSIKQGLVKDANDMFNVLDSAGEGSCSSGDLASGALDIGITLKPKLLPRLIETIVGRSNAKSIRASEFVAFIKKNR